MVDTSGPMPRTAIPLVDAMLGVLGAWRPGVQSSEERYHVKLHGALRRKLLDVLVESEARRKDRYGLPRKIDLLLSRGAESVLVELKASTKTGALDRGTTQVGDYAQLGLGPVLVVLCGADPGEPRVQRLVDNVGAQRSLGLPLGVVLAAVRGAPATVVGGLVAAVTPSAAAARPPSGRGLPHVATAAAISMFFAWEMAHLPAPPPQAAPPEALAASAPASRPLPAAVPACPVRAEPLRRFVDLRVLRSPCGMRLVRDLQEVRVRPVPRLLRARRGRVQADVGVHAKQLPRL